MEPVWAEVYLEDGVWRWSIIFDTYGYDHAGRSPSFADAVGSVIAAQATAIAARATAIAAAADTRQTVSQVKRQRSAKVATRPVPADLPTTSP